MWGVIYRNKLAQYKAKKEVKAFEGTSFYLYDDLEKAIEARDRLSGRYPLNMVVVDMDEVHFIPFKKNKRLDKSSSL